MKSITPWLCAAIFIAAWLGLCAHFDHERFEPRDQAQQEADELANREWVAQQVCGQNSGHRWEGDKTLVCFTHQGIRVAKVQL